MNNNETDEIARQLEINTENEDLSRFERVIQRGGDGRLCFYCNFSLECGQKECIWREDDDDPVPKTTFMRIKECYDKRDSKNT